MIEYNYSVIIINIIGEYAGVIMNDKYGMINEIASKIFNTLKEMYNTQISEIEEKINKEKNQGAKKKLIEQRKQIINNFSIQVSEMVNNLFDEDEKKEIITWILDKDGDFKEVYNKDYRSTKIDLDALFFLMQGLITNISDKEFLSTASEKYFRKINEPYEMDLLFDVDIIGGMFVFANYHKSVLLLQQCKDRKIVKDYISSHMESKFFLEQLSEYQGFESIISESIIESFDALLDEDNERAVSFLIEKIETKNLPKEVIETVAIEIGKSHPQIYKNYLETTIDRFLLTDYESVINYIMDGNKDNRELPFILLYGKINSEELLKIFDDKRVVDTFRGAIPLPEYSDGETKYEILFHTLTGQYAINNNILNDIIFHADSDFKYAIMSHEDSLKIILSSPEIITEFCDSYLRNNIYSVNINEKFLEIFKNNLSSKQLAILFRPNSLSENTCIKSFMDDEFVYRILNVYHPTINPTGEKNKITEVKKVQELIIKLHNDNQFLFKTFNPNVINDNFLNLDYNLISFISKYDKLQEKIIEKSNIDKFNEFGKTESMHHGFLEGWGKDHSTYMTIDSQICINTFMEMLSVISSVDPESINNYLEVINSITKIDNVGLDPFNDPYLMDNSSIFEKFVVNVCQGLDLKTISKDQLLTLTKIFLNDPKFTGSHSYIFVDINNIEDIDTYDERRNKKLDELFVKSIKDKNLESAINIYLNKYFNIDLDRAREIIMVYGGDIDNIKGEKYKNSIEIIKQLKKIITINNITDLFNLYQNSKIISFEDSIKFNNSLTKLFGYEFSNGTTKFENMTIVSANSLGFPPSVKVLTPNEDFILMVHSTAAYGEMKIIDGNYKKSWNESENVKNHGICCSLIANDYLGTATINDVLLGFNDISDSSLVTAAPYDIYSINNGINITSMKKSKFLSPRELINNTRHGHNELGIERREMRQSKIIEGQINLQPTYVVVFDEMTPELKAKAIKCAEDFNIPIVYINKEKVINNELATIDKMIEELRSEIDISRKIELFSEIYQRYENNRCGLAHDEKYQELFSIGKIQSVLDEIVEKIKNDKDNTHDYETYLKNALHLIQVLKKEEDKFITSYEEGSRIAANDLDVKEYINSLITEINPDLSKGNDSKLSFVSTFIQADDTSLSQIIREIDVKQIETEISELNNNFSKDSSKKHEIGHIERVTLLASIIGKRELKDDLHSQELLRLAAELHDSGRTDDYHDPQHGQKGAEYAKEALKEKVENGSLSEKDLRIIQLVIESHNLKHREFDYDISKLAEKYGISKEEIPLITTISICLRDADALDRVRFHDYRARLNEDALKTETGHLLVETSKRLFREYEEYDEKKMIEKTREKCKERDESRSKFKESEFKYKIKSKFELLKSKFVRKITSNDLMEEGDNNGIHRGL